MPRVADVVDAVIGGDTHSEFHQLEIATPVAAPIAVVTVENNQSGYAAAIGWIAAHAPGPRLMVGLEGTRSYGVGLQRALREAGFTVVEVEQPSTKSRRGKGKSDPIDAHHAVVATLAMDADQLPEPRADGDREALRILMIGHRETTDTKTARSNALRALLITGEDEDRALSRGKFTVTRLQTIARRRSRAGDTLEQTIRRTEARRLALWILDARRELLERHHQIEELVNVLAPGMTAQRGVGPISAALLLLTFSHAGRFLHEAQFANITGAAPVEASSGKTGTRHRLNYGGDRQANRALHDIAQNRMRCCPRTKTYVARRLTEGKTLKEIRRCLKRYIAREQFRFMANAMA